MTKLRRLAISTFAGLVFLMCNTLISVLLRLLVFSRVQPVWLSILDNVVSTVVFVIVVSILLQYQYRTDLSRIQDELGIPKEDRRAGKDRRTSQN
jgi:hypothetical protein